MLIATECNEVLLVISNVHVELILISETVSAAIIRDWHSSLLCIYTLYMQLAVRVDIHVEGWTNTGADGRVRCSLFLQYHRSHCCLTWEVWDVH
jgi:hypothetical protein